MDVERHLQSRRRSVRLRASACPESTRSSQPAKSSAPSPDPMPHHGHRPCSAASSTRFSGAEQLIRGRPQQPMNGGSISQPPISSRRTRSRRKGSTNSRRALVGPVHRTSRTELAVLDVRRLVADRGGVRVGVPRTRLARCSTLATGSRGVSAGAAAMAAIVAGGPGTVAAGGRAPFAARMILQEVQHAARGLTGP